MAVRPCDVAHRPSRAGGLGQGALEQGADTPSRVPAFRLCGGLRRDHRRHRRGAAHGPLCAAGGAPGPFQPVDLLFPDAGRRAERMAGRLRQQPARADALDQGLYPGGAARAGAGVRRAGAVDPDRPLAAVDAVRPGRVVGGAAAGVQGHAAVAGGQHAADLERHAAHRRLDRDAAMQCRWLRQGHRAAYGQGAELGQHRDHGADLQAVFGELPQLPPDVRVRRAPYQADAAHRREQRALPGRRRGACADALPVAARLPGREAGQGRRGQPAADRRRQ
ncbi:hypothetical protein D9M72_214780 [compost metagenome]